MFGFWKRYRQKHRREALYSNVCDYLARHYKPGAKFSLPPAAPDAGGTGQEEPSGFKYSLSDYQEPEKSGTAAEPRMEFRNGEPVLLQMPPDRPTFTNEVKRLMIERNLTGTEVCRRILMDRRLWSKLNTDAEYQPSRETATAICIALHLNIEQAQQLLQYAGYTLSCARRQDVVMRYFFVNGIYDVDEINSILYRLGLKCIGTNVRE